MLCRILLEAAAATWASAIVTGKKVVLMERSQMTYEVYIGMDVGKESCYVTALAASGDERLFEGPVRQSEPEIREMLGIAALLGRPLLIVDVWGGFGTLPVLVAIAMGVDVAHMPSRRFSQVAGTYGEDKYDELDSFVLADASRWRPSLIDLVGPIAASVEEVKILTAARLDFLDERTRCYNRTHDLLQRVCPPLEELFRGDRLHAKIALQLLARYGGPDGFRRSGRNRCAKWAGGLKNQRAMGPRKVDEIFDAIESQTVAHPASDVAEAQIRSLCKRIIELNAQIAEVERSIEKRSGGIPAAALLSGIPGVGKWTSAVIASQIGDIARFRSANALASYAGLAPCVRKSSKSLNMTKARRGGNRTLKNAIVQSVQIALTWDGPEREQYFKKRAEGKKHRQAIRALARKRVEVIYAMLSNGTCYEPPRATE